MARDIDYAAVTVRKAIEEKFGRQTALDDLSVAANETTISIRDGDRAAQASRHELLAALRDAAVYDDFWTAITQRPSHKSR